MTVKPSKTKSGFSEVDFVGHIVKAGTVVMDPEKLGRISEAPRPQNKRQVLAYLLGLVGYCRNFVPNFAERATPLADLTRKGFPNVVQWGAAPEQAFKDLREILIKAPILSLLNLQKLFTVQTDASHTLDRGSSVARTRRWSVPCSVRKQEAFAWETQIFSD